MTATILMTAALTQQRRRRQRAARSVAAFFAHECGGFSDMMRLDSTQHVVWGSLSEVLYSLDSYSLQSGH